uniref:WD repeat domain 54 n=1 Tax=Laticauda laticaudata TaxID=8630 RepID=A0A8C5SFZ5_LATLA
MYRRERSVPLRGSSLALYNNLAVLPLPAKRLSYFASVHGASVGLVSAAADGAGCAHRQLQAREGGLGPPIVTQAAWCALPSRTLLVLASWKGIQMYEPDGSAMVYWHALDGMESAAGMLLFSRGIAGTGLHFVCVGTSTGSVLVFDVPAKGTNITLSEVLEQHSSPITDIGAELCEQPEGAADLVTADDSGALCVWGSGETFRLITKIPASDCTCSSVKLWNGVIAAGYGNGQIRLYEAAHGTLRAQVSAHARWIYALDLAPLSGKLLSAAEDSFVQVWGLSYNADTDSLEITHCHTECVTDTQICGARFCNPEGTAFAITGFELSEIILYHQV